MGRTTGFRCAEWKGNFPDMHVHNPMREWLKLIILEARFKGSSGIRYFKTTCYFSYVHSGKGTVRSWFACHPDWWLWKGGCLPWLPIDVFCKIPDCKLVRTGSTILWRTSRRVEAFHLRCVKKTWTLPLPVATEIMVPERSQDVCVNRLMYSTVTLLMP